MFLRGVPHSHNIALVHHPAVRGSGEYGFQSGGRVTLNHCTDAIQHAEQKTSLSHTQRLLPVTAECRGTFEQTAVPIGRIHIKIKHRSLFLQLGDLRTDGNPPFRQSQRTVYDFALLVCKKALHAYKNRLRIVQG
ncbi:hypothetical protein D3C76_1352740 [compost metagenome]